MLNKRTLFFLSAASIMVVLAGCGGGGGGSNPVSPSGGGDKGSTADSGGISGKVTPENGSELSRAVGREAAASSINAQVYAHPHSTSDKNLKPNSNVPYARTDSNGNYTITNVPVGTNNLVIDYDSDGIADERQFDVSVSKNSTTSAGTTEVAALNKDPKGSWCDVELDKVNYSPGETVRMSVRGYNYDTTSMKCGVKIILQKGQGQTQVWITDFNDSSTYMAMAAGSTASGTIEKVIPTTWEPTNSQAGSDYRVYTIKENGTKWGKGDNFNITCTAACAADSECNDGNADTTDICANPGACGALCSNVQCAVACASASACDDSNSLTTDTCNNAGTCSAACAHTQCDISCSSNSDCNDGNSTTTDVCVNSGTCEAACLNNPCAVECSKDADCNDNIVLTTDTCSDPGMCYSSCSNIACTPACINNTDCDDSNSLTTDTCYSPNTCVASCSSTPCNVACSSDSNCDDSNSLTTDACYNPGTCDAACSNTPCDITCSSDSDCDDQDVDTYDSCSDSGTCEASCAHQSGIHGKAYLDGLTDHSGIIISVEGTEISTTTDKDGNYTFPALEDGNWNIKAEHGCTFSYEDRNCAVECGFDATCNCYISFPLLDTNLEQVSIVNGQIPGGNFQDIVLNPKLKFALETDRNNYVSMVDGIFLTLNVHSNLDYTVYTHSGSNNKKVYFEGYVDGSRYDGGQMCLPIGDILLPAFQDIDINPGDNEFTYVEGVTDEEFDSCNVNNETSVNIYLIFAFSHINFHNCGTVDWKGFRYYPQGQVLPVVTVTKE